MKKSSFEFLLSLRRPSGLQSRAVVAVAEEEKDLRRANFSAKPAFMYFVVYVHVLKDLFSLDVWQHESLEA